MDTEIVVSRLRTFLLGLAGLTFIVTVIELLLEDHTKEALQFVPFALCLIGFIAVISVLYRPGSISIRNARIALVIVGIGGMIGGGIHLLENFEFERDVHPTAAILNTLVATLKGAAPLLAPGVLVFAALIALAATYYHPALDKSD